MRRCRVVEDSDQKVDHKEKPELTEKAPYISEDSGICAASGGVLERNLSSPPVWTLQVAPMTDRFAAARRGTRTQDVVLVTKIDHCSDKVTAPLQQLGKHDQVGLRMNARPFL
jgi:hypothetical protein